MIGTDGDSNTPNETPNETPDGCPTDLPTDKTYRLLLRVVRFLLHLCTRRTTRGQEHLPSTGPVLVVGNHLSVADAFVLVTSIARCGRRIRMLGTAGLFGAPVVGWVLRHAGYVPVHRRSADPATALAPALAALRAGQVVGLYPEGGITRDPEHWPVRGKTGVVRLALDSGAPVVPLVQWGTQRWVGGEGTRWRALLSPLLRPRIAVVLGAPMDLRALLGVDRAVDASPEQLRQGADAVMAAIVGLLAELRGETPPARAGREPQPAQ